MSKKIERHFTPLHYMPQERCEISFTPSQQLSSACLY